MRERKINISRLVTSLQGRLRSFTSMGRFCTAHQHDATAGSRTNVDKYDDIPMGVLPAAIAAAAAVAMNEFRHQLSTKPKHWHYRCYYYYYFHWEAPDMVEPNEAVQKRRNEHNVLAPLPYSTGACAKKMMLHIYFAEQTHIKNRHIQNVNDITCYQNET